MKDKARSAAFLCTMILCSSGCANAQACPKDDGSLTPGQPTTLTGTVRYHNQLREWIGLEVSPPICGQKEFQLTFYEGDASLHYREAISQNGCKAKVTGIIGISGTGYYSADRYIVDGKISLDPSCKAGPLRPDLWNAPVQAGVKRYQASVTLDLSQMKKPMRVKVWRDDSIKGELLPWQAYVNPSVTGDFGLWVNCSDGFEATLQKTVIDGKSETHVPSEYMGTPGMAPSLTRPSSITVTCVRSSNDKKPTVSEAH